MQIVPDVRTGCLVYQGVLNEKGYPRNRLHRTMYAAEVGPIPPGWAVDHVYERGCRYRACVNPAHLEAVPVDENWTRAHAARRAGHRRRDQRAMMLPLVTRPLPLPYYAPATRLWDPDSELAAQVARWEVRPVPSPLVPA